MNTNPFFALATSAALLAACASTPAPAAQESLNGQWRITEISGQAVNLPQAEIRFDTEKLGVAATVGCNRIFGRYHLHESVLTFSPPASTRMACPNPEQAKLETALGRALAGAAGGSYRIEGKTLTILDRDGTAVLKADR